MQPPARRDLPTGELPPRRRQSFSTHAALVTRALSPSGYLFFPSRRKPEDWDDEEDGEWEVPQIDNPEFKGAWKAKKVANPDYKGPWVQKKIANPEFKNDTALYNVCAPCSAVGFELWQVKAGSIFDDIIVTDSAAEAQAFYDETFGAKADKEKEVRGLT